MQYIDADKLIAEIEKRIELNRKMLEIDARPSDWGRIEEGNYFLRYIEHIQQEQPEVDLEKEVEFYCINQKVKMTIQELIDYYIDTECAETAIECGF